MVEATGEESELEELQNRVVERLLQKLPLPIQLTKPEIDAALNRSGSHGDGDAYDLLLKGMTDDTAAPSVDPHSRWWMPEWPRSAFAVSTNWSVAAEVKKIEPTKKTRPSIREPTSSTKPGNGPTRKHVEPIPKSTPIHHEARRGAHQTPGCSLARERRDACLRWKRDDHSTSSPSGFLKLMCVVNGPTERVASRSQSSGALG